MANFKGFCYNLFGFFGDKFASIFPWIDKWIEVSGLKIHPSVYFSITSFILILSTFPSILFILLVFIAFLQIDLPQPLFNLFYSLSFLPIPLVIFLIILPLIVFSLSLFLPIFISKSKIYGFELELPYLSAYLTIMVSSGLSLYRGLKRVMNSKVFSRAGMYVSEVEVSSIAKGIDPLYILEDFASKISVKGFKELVSGYISTLRSGGDVADYVYNRTEILFQEMLSRVKAVADRLGLLMEALITVLCLGGIGLNLFFICSMSMSDVLGIPAMNGDIFFIFSFILLPLINIIFIYFADSTQISYPEKVFKRYIPFLILLPILFVTIFLIVIPYVFDNPIPQFLNPIVEFVKDIASSRAGNVGFTPSIILCLTLIIISIPAAIYDIFLSKIESAYESGLTSFLRDLVEVRKSGLPPEKCLILLSNRRYGRFNKILDNVRRGIIWGLPLRKIFEKVFNELDNWLVSVNLFLLVDTIEIGGGSIETLESMTKFSETSMLVEKERKALLKPLILVPYFGAILLILVGISFLSFMNNMLSISGSSLPMVSLIKILMTPLPIQIYTLGLAAGKMSSGRVSGGFIHAILLTTIALMAILFNSSINLSGFIMGG
ncbi:MAG: type II secretion system F family protein [Candidatus Methanomethylicia archaeon]